MKKFYINERVNIKIFIVNSHRKSSFYLKVKICMVINLYHGKFKFNYVKIEIIYGKYLKIMTEITILEADTIK